MQYNSRAQPAAHHGVSELEPSGLGAVALCPLLHNGGTASHEAAERVAATLHQKSTLLLLLLN